MATINEVVQAAKALDDAKAVLEDLRAKKQNAQAAIDAINLQIPAAKTAVANAKATLTTLVTAFDPT